MSDFSALEFFIRFAAKQQLFSRLVAIIHAEQSFLRKYQNMTTSPSLSISETAALLDEVAAGIRAEIPLTASLATLQGREAGRIAVVAAKIRQSIESGVPLDKAISDQLEQQQGAIAAALKLGLQSGDTARSLRALAKLMLERRELRMRQLAASIYPLMILALGYLIGVFIFSNVLVLQEDLVGWSSVAIGIATWLEVYWWLPPIVFILAFMIVRLSGLYDRFPQFMQPLRWSNQALFCDAVAWQLEHGVPMPNAIRAAAAMADCRTLSADAEIWAESLEQGHSSQPQFAALFPLVVWTLSTWQASAPISTGITFSNALGRLSESYRSAEKQAWAFWTQWLPVVAASLIGGILSISYLLIVIWPLYDKLAEGFR